MVLVVAGGPLGGRRVVPPHSRCSPATSHPHPTRRLAVACGPMPEPGVGRRRRLAEELEESGLRPGGTEAFREMLSEEIDHALRPPVHERRVRSGGTILE